MGAVHRDVKDSNVILRGSDAVLIDFDASRIVKPECPADTVILGTTGYAAPEQFGLSQTDGRADIYSLGVLLPGLARKELPAQTVDSEPAGLAGTFKEDTCQAYYEGADGRTYHVFVCFSPQPSGGASPASHRTELLPADEPGTSPLCLFVRDAEDRSKDVRARFPGTAALPQGGGRGRRRQ